MIFAKHCPNILTQAVKKYNRLLKYPTINGGARFIYRDSHNYRSFYLWRWSQLPILQSRYRETNFLFTHMVKTMYTSKNGFTEVVENVRLKHEFIEMRKMSASVNHGGGYS